MKNLAQKNVLILGLGASGLAMARWCARCGAQVTVADTRPAPPQLAALQMLVPAARFINAAMDKALLAGAGFDIVLKSPGLSPASVSDVITAAQARGIPRSNELSLFAQALTDLKSDQAYSPKVVGITGTNGKTTVTSLAGQLIRRAGKSVAVAGNIGPTLLETLAEKLDQQLQDDALELPEVWVLELSSFQLDGVSNFDPAVATVLNISQDHLDWHETRQAYIAAKKNVYGGGLMLLNRDDPLVMAALPALVKGKQARGYTTFGGDPPKRPGDYGIETVNGMAWLVRAVEADVTIKCRKADGPPPHIQQLMPLPALRIHGRHNATNALAALALAVAVGCPLAPLLHGLRDYRGEPHRMESVAVRDQVEYFDDSKGTNVGATVAALAGLGAERKLVLILGGDGKQQDFSPLADPVSRYVRAVVLIGRDAPVIRAALQGIQVPLLDACSMYEAVRVAARQARSGDAVLLSPACASFDMFENYAHRAQAFRDAVQGLAQETGAVL